MTNTSVAAESLTDTMVANVTAHFLTTTAADMANGMGWYSQAWEEAKRIDPSNPVMVAGVIAALSPRCMWGTNVKWAEMIVTAAKNGDAIPSVHTTAMRNQAWRIANGESPLSVLNGPKVRSFFANIVGDTDAVTCDVWAVFAATGSKDAKAVSTPKRYAMVAEAYRIAAKNCGVTPREMQAAVWVHVRGTKVSDGGFNASAIAIAA